MGLMQPTRHALGALILNQGHVAEAEVIYRKDPGPGVNLTRAQVHPDYIWSLRGLNDCLAASDSADTVEGRLIAQRLNLDNSRADRIVGGSCFCAQAVGSS